MKVCLYSEAGPLLRGSGIGTAVNQQIRALDYVDVLTTKSHREKFDIIDINTIGPRSAYVAHKMRWKGIPVVMHTHTTAEDFKDSFMFSDKLAPRLKNYLSYFYSQADMLISPTEYARRVVEGYGVKTKNARVVSNGVDTDLFVFDQRLREEFRISHRMSGICVYCVGHVFKRKGVVDFLELANKFKDNSFTWIGRIYKDLAGGDIVKAVKAKTPNSNFLGYVRDIHAAHCGGDIFFFPSFCENQGIAILEAASCSRPIIVRDIPAYEGWLKDGVNCLKASDLSQFEKCLKTLIEDEALREKLGENARLMAQKHCLNNVGVELKNAYESVLGVLD